MSEETQEQSSKPRRRQLDGDGDYTQTLLNSLTLEQIREAIYRLAPGKKIALRTHAESLGAMLSTGATIDAIQKTLLDVERMYPFKHCLLLHLDTEVSTSALPEAGQTFSNGGFSFTLSHISLDPVISLTFEHSVEFKEWIEVEKDVRKKCSIITRQPIIVRAQPSRNLLTLSYPGYSHSNNSVTGASGYETVIENLLKILSGVFFGWRIKILPIKNALKYFIEGPNKRVLQVKADVDTPLARFDVSAKGESNNIEEALASFLSAHLPGVEKDALVIAAKQAFNSAIHNSIVLYWLQEGLFTRLRFWDVGTELFFVWNKEAASYRLVDEITCTLSETSCTQANVNESTEPALSWEPNCSSYGTKRPPRIAWLMK